MKNSFISQQQKQQEQELQSKEKIGMNQEKLLSIKLKNREASHQACNSDIHITIEGER